MRQPESLIVSKLSLEGSISVNRQERIRLVMEIGDAAADYEMDQERNAHIDQACGGDEELKQQVMEYLRAGEDLFNETASPKRGPG